MEQRHSINQSHLYEMDHEQIWNHPQHDHHLNFGNSSMLPSENTATNGVNPVTYFDSHLRSNNHRMEYFNYQVPAHVPTNETHGFSHNQYAVGDIRRNINPLIEMEYERAPYIRKYPTNFMFPHRETRNRYYNAGSSSNPTISTEISPGKPPYDSQCWPCDPSHRGQNSSNSGQGSQRNVRSRLDTAIHLENISSGVRSTTNSSHLVQSVASTSNANMGAQWIHGPVFINPNSRSFSSETNSSNRDINHSFVASHGTTNNTDIGAYRSSLLTHSGSLSRGRMMSPSIHGQRTAYRVNPGYQAVDLAATSQDTRLQRVESARFSMRPMPSPIVRQNNGRNGRMSRSNRFRSFLDEDASHVRRAAEEGVALMDHPDLYHPVHFLDQHRDMRLDIDNMSYEELLALEESIGNVSTGVSENAVRRCLRETIFCSDRMEDGDEEDNCPICLEAYRDRDTLGRLNCKHIFHSSCVKKWLLIKNICPICKASAVDDTLKEK